MDTGELKEKFQSAFENMLTQVEEFVDKEKQSLSDALENARGSMHNLEEMTAEEVEHVSHDFVEHLHEVREQGSELKEGIRDAIKIDSMYIQSGIIERLLKVADQTSVELIRLNSELAERILEAESEEENSHDEENTSV